jgi:hypothetical protein
MPSFASVLFQYVKALFTIPFSAGQDSLIAAKQYCKSGYPKALPKMPFYFMTIHSIKHALRF